MGWAGSGVDFTYQFCGCVYEEGFVLLEGFGGAVEEEGGVDFEGLGLVGGRCFRYRYWSCVWLIGPGG